MKRIRAAFLRWLTDEPGLLDMPAMPIPAAPPRVPIPGNPLTPAEEREFTLIQLHYSEKTDDPTEQR